MITDMGKFLDPIADKVLVLTALALMLTDINGGVLDKYFGGIGISLILARELIVSSFRMVAAGKKVVIAADKLGKIKTFSQDIAVLLLLVGKSFSGDLFNWIYYVGLAVYVFSVVMTVLSGISYIYKNRKVLS